MRNSDAGCYAAMLEGRAVKILSMKPFPGAAKNLPLWQRRTQNSLGESALPQDNTNVIFEFGFSATGSNLTAFINEMPVLQVKDTALSEGTVGMGGWNNPRVQIGNVELFIPNKGSLVADHRTAAPAAKTGAAGEFKFPPSKPIPTVGGN